MTLAKPLTPNPSPRITRARGDRNSYLARLTQNAQVVGKYALAFLLSR